MPSFKITVAEKRNLRKKVRSFSIHKAGMKITEAVYEAEKIIDWMTEEIVKVELEF